MAVAFNHVISLRTTDSSAVNVMNVKTVVAKDVDSEVGTTGTSIADSKLMLPYRDTKIGVVPACPDGAPVFGDFDHLVNLLSTT